jgi:hypothetical protein
VVTNQWFLDVTGKSAQEFANTHGGTVIVADTGTATNPTYVKVSTGVYGVVSSVTPTTINFSGYGGTNPVLVAAVVGHQPTAAATVTSVPSYASASIAARQVAPIPVSRLLDRSPVVGCGTAALCRIPSVTADGGYTEAKARYFMPYTPLNLSEELVLEDAMGGGGTRIMGTMNFPAGGTKYQVVQNGIVVHYMCNTAGICGDYKFVK